MTRTAPHGRPTTLLVGPLLLLLVAHAEARQPPRPDLARDPLLPPQAAAEPPAAPTPARPADRVRLFRIQPGFLSGTPGLELDQPEADVGAEGVAFSFGNDNPFFDFRRQGDPGGVGFARVETQVQLFGTSTTALALGVQAVAPAGLEYDGLPDRMGTTVLTPALSVFHTLDGATAVQAFVGKHVPIQNSAAQGVRRDVRYGMAVQRPVSRGDDPLRFLYLSVGALGLYRVESGATAFEVLPGLHYKAGESWWISGGLSLPVGPKPDAGQAWQLTCSWQF